MTKGNTAKFVIGSLVGAVVLQVTLVACGKLENGGGLADMLPGAVADMLGVDKPVDLAMAAGPSAPEVCGLTANKFQGNIGMLAGAQNGYALAKAQCALLAGCGTGHMCTAQEIAAIEASGGSLPMGDGWYAAGIRVDFPIGPNGTNVLSLNDCANFSSVNNAYAAPMWSGGLPSYAKCNDSLPILCCK